MTHKQLCLLCLLTLAFSCSRPPSGQIITYPAIADLPTSDIYSLAANNEPIWVEKVRTNFELEKLPDWFTGSAYVNEQQQVHIANFSCQGPMQIKLAIAEKVDSVSIHPLSKNIQTAVEEHTISFQLAGPEKLYIKVNNLPPLCLFANPLETEIPDSTDANVIYFAPGVHRPGMLHPTSGTTIYIAGGAIVYGGIETNGERDIKILGRGILDGDFTHSRMVKPQNSTNLLVDGIIIRRGGGWTNTIINCDSVLYHNVKVISFCPGGDGINPLNSRHVRIDNCFLRCTDDCIAIKAPNPDIPSYDIRVTNNTMIGFAYSDGCTIGYETNAPSISDVLVKNCDIIQARGGSRVDGHSAFSIICDGPAKIHDIHFEDLRAEADVLKLFELTITDGSLYGIDPPGHIADIFIKNISWNSIRPIILHGLDAEHLVENVVFENCKINGDVLSKARPDIFNINKFVNSVSFK